MPISTYLYQSQHTAPTLNAEINSVLADVRKASGDDWRVAEHQVEQRSRLLGRRSRAVYYEVLKHIVGSEYQVLNFYRAEREGKSGGSINTFVSADYVVAFLYGVLAGHHSGVRKSQPPKEN